jgi:hypothetical protein
VSEWGEFGRQPRKEQAVTQDPMARLDHYDVVGFSPNGHQGGIVIESWPKTPEGSGALNAAARAAFFSLANGPHEVYRPDGRLLARYEHGKQVFPSQKR